MQPGGPKTVEASARENSPPLSFLCKTLTPRKTKFCGVSHFQERRILSYEVVALDLFEVAVGGYTQLFGRRVVAYQNTVGVDL